MNKPCCFKYTRRVAISVFVLIVVYTLIFTTTSNGSSSSLQRDEITHVVSVSSSAKVGPNDEKMTMNEQQHSPRAYKTSSKIQYFVGLRGMITRNVTLYVPEESSSPNGHGTDSVMSSGSKETSDSRPNNPLCVDNIKESSVQLILLWLCLAASLVIMYILHRFHAAWFPESIGVLFLGVIVGIIARYAIPSSWVQVEVFTQLDPGIFFSFFLPAIIFDAGFTLDRAGFFGNIGGIILYALVGTFTSSLVVGCGLYILGYYGLSIELGLVESLMFGSLISATDPVATLAIFCALGVPSTLHYLVFGESIVNDAIAIVLYETFEKFREAGKDDLVLVTFKSMGQFLYVSIGSILVALVFGILSSLIFKYGALRHTPKLEMAIFFVLAYLSYLVSLPYLSGIMTILVVGILMNQYSKPNLSEQTATALLTVSNALAMICETFTFLYIGFALFAFENNKWDVRFIVFTILLCLIGRFLNIVPLSGILNMYREHKISMKYQFIMWFSGLRGAIAFALSMSLKSEGGKGEYIFTTTLATVFFTIIFLGGGTFPVLKITKVQQENQIVAPQALVKKDHWLVKLDKNYFQKWFIRQDVREQMLAQEQAAIAEYKEKKEEQQKQEEEEALKRLETSGNESSGNDHEAPEKFVEIELHENPIANRM
ncbi:hypothetical protein C9374_000287 [Naegleria lovaniensis]|uniref:Sodium/hydrogen exchanger n=1 Tax=Naegleria lovaniensis TaxID=51637 RepID=A0AA88GYS2_NAELO|nr:uncharacterized protein C9374_000287 [Naegleria lovaniensis]KAG2388848.1 hypothetical protein C9374_000287 [Naegleria lovaniensis]